MKKFFLIFYILFLPVFSYTQNIDDLENQYYKLDHSLVKGTRILDSLKNIYDAKLKLIGQEKEKNNQEKVIELMSGSASLSNRIGEQQKKVFKIETEIENLKENLQKNYTNILDSLYTLEWSKDRESAILLYTERKLLTSPKISALSFDPAKLLQLNPDKVTNPQEKKLYNNYLKNALSEVEKNLVEIDKIHNEVKNAISLQNKTRRFLEEVEFEGTIRRPNPNQKLTSVDVEDAFTNLGPARGNELINQNAKGFLLILNQLNLNAAPAKLELYGSWNKNYSLDEYYNLLKEVKKSLQDYKLVLSNKIGSVK